MKKILKNKKGFTLVELIVVIAILGVLAVIMVPAFTGYVQKANDSKYVSSAKSWCTAYQAAYADNQVTANTWNISTATGALDTVPEISAGTAGVENSILAAAPEYDTDVAKIVIGANGSCTVSNTK